MVLLANVFGVLSDIPACLQSDFASHGLDAYGWFGFWTGMLLATVMVVIPKFRFKWLSQRGLDGFVGAIFVVVAMLTGHLLGVAIKGLCHL
jgi:glucose-6-phosphate-specific signal transduction histidine kinase